MSDEQPIDIETALAEADRLLSDLGRVVQRRARYKRLHQARLRALAARLLVLDSAWAADEESLRTRLRLVHQAIREVGGSNSYALPAGDLGSSRATEWSWPEKAEEVAAFVATLPPAFVRTHPEPDKPAIKAAAVVRKEGVFIPDAEGEMVKLEGVGVTPVRNWWARPALDQAVEADDEESDDGDQV